MQPTSNPFRLSKDEALITKLLQEEFRAQQLTASDKVFEQETHEQEILKPLREQALSELPDNYRSSALAAMLATEERYQCHALREDQLDGPHHVLALKHREEILDPLREAVRQNLLGFEKEVGLTGQDGFYAKLGLNSPDPHAAAHPGKVLEQSEHEPDFGA